MSNERIDMHRLQDLVRMHREGVGCREIARLLKMSPNTERKYRHALNKADLLKGEPSEIVALDVLKQAVAELLPPAKPPQETSTVEPWRAQIEKMYGRTRSPRAIFDRLRLEHDDFDGSLSAVKRMCARIKADRGPRPEDVVIGVETAPGKIAQVDFGYVGKLFDPLSGKVRKAYAFVMVLGFSRLMYVDLVFDQKIDTWLRLHVDAFEYFGGVPETVVPDNLKAAVVRCYFGLKDKPELNRSYRELARHYGFMVDPTPPYAPEKKGKVESAVKYVKGNFFAPRALEKLDEAKEQLALWLDRIANQRVHGTTRRMPRELFDLEEAGALKSLPPTRFVPVVWKQAKVHRDSHVEFERRLYSVPFRLIGRTVWIRARGKSVDIFYDDEPCASHRRSGPRKSTREAHLPEGRRDLRHRSRQWWQDKADRMSPIVGEYIEEVFAADDVFNQLRCVQSIVSYLEQFPIERAEGACHRARAFGNYTYQGIKRILVEGIDLQPAVPQAVYVHGKLAHPRFARNFEELAQAEEVKNERS
jgi:transposase